MKVSVRFSSFIFCTCVSVWLPEKTLKLALEDVFNNHLFEGFWKGWMVFVVSLVRLLYDFVPEHCFLHFLITGYDDSLPRRAVYESLTYPDPLLPKCKVYLLCLQA